MGVMRRLGPKTLWLFVGVTLLVAGKATSHAEDARMFAAHALAFRSAAIEDTASTTGVLATMPAAGRTELLPALWRPFFENAIVKLGRLRAPAPVALFYNPLLDVALVTFWEKREEHYRIASIRALPGERLVNPGAAAPEHPEWIGADDPAAALARIAHERLSAFRRAHPAEVREGGHDDATFSEAASDMRAALPRLIWLFAIRAQWAAETDPWLIPALVMIDEALAFGDAATLLASAPDTDTETAVALAQLPPGFVERLTLDMTLEIGGPDRLLIASSIDDGDIYAFVLCRLEDGECSLSRFILLSLSGSLSGG